MTYEEVVAELETARRERDLYRRLLDLGDRTELEPLLQEALALIVEVTRARLGYLELCDDDGGIGEARWSISSGCSNEEVAEIRSRVSRGIVAEALAAGRTVMTPSALLDPRFQGRPSVRSAHIEAVVCAPIGSDPPLGVLYLQGTETGPFAPSDREKAEVFARHLTPLADRLLIRHRHAADATQPFRSALRVHQVIGRSAALAAALQQVALVAPLDVTVLLTGESGTGKSKLARVIHDNGPRAMQPFVELNCAALPETLLESELFGSMPGAHSTALRRTEGKVASAQGGTLFLDEIGELTPSAQAKLLHLLQSRLYYPLGGTKPVAADVRVLAATNIDLRVAVSERRFREDLLYRLQVLPIRVPSLMERRDDIPELAAFFCDAACRRHGLPRVELSKEALRAAQAAEWPGNVRQLAHAVEAAAIRAAGMRAARIEARHLFPDPMAPDAEPPVLSFQEATRRFQAALVHDALEDANWNVADVANRLDLARSHVYNLIRAFGLQRRST
jgi:Nif-specific regulatory protein